MRENCKKLLVLGVFCLMLGMCLTGIRTEAASKKAVKVKSSVSYKNYNKERMTVKGLDSKGRTVWTYKTKYRPATQLRQTKCVVRNTRVYIFEGSQVRVVKKSNGKKIWVRKKISPAGHMITFDSKNNLYVIGYYDDTVYKVSSKGKIVWKKSIENTGNYWPYKLKCSGSKLKIMFDANMNDYSSKKHSATLSMKTGKILSYK